MKKKSGNGSNGHMTVGKRGAGRGEGGKGEEICLEGLSCSIHGSSKFLKLDPTRSIDRSMGLKTELDSGGPTCWRPLLAYEAKN